MELKRALSNPRLQVELGRLTEVLGSVGTRAATTLSPRHIKRRRTPLLSTVVQVLERTNNEPMKLRDIHARCELILGQPVSYRALKTGLRDHERTKRPKVVRETRGHYRLT